MLGAGSALPWACPGRAALLQSLLHRPPSFHPFPRNFLILREEHVIVTALPQLSMTELKWPGHRNPSSDLSLKAEVCVTCSSLSVFMSPLVCPRIRCEMSRPGCAQAAHGEVSHAERCCPVPQPVPTGGRCSAGGTVHRSRAGDISSLLCFW